MSTQEFRVLGMSCGHCVTFVTEAVETLDGVESVEVDLPGEKVTVVSAQPLDSAALGTALDDAGYELADR
jgi:copper chaperone